MIKKDMEYRYNTGAAKVPWVAVGEEYKEPDVLEVIRFLMQGEGEEYDKAFAAVREKVLALGELAHTQTSLTLGSKTKELEAFCNEYLGVPSSTFVTNATSAFELAYKYAGVGPGDEVIVPAITFVATMVYPLSAGAKLVFADVDPKTMNMDPADVARKITDKTKMIVPVHLGGYPVDMDPIIELAKQHDIIVLEDAAHAFGAQYKGRKIGTIGDFGGFSFHSAKNVTAFGEGGLLSSKLPEMDSHFKRARFVGVDHDTPAIDNWLYNVTLIPGKNKPFVAQNITPTELQALGLLLQVHRNDEIIAKRREAAEYLNMRFAGCPAIIPQEMGDGDYMRPAFHMYLLRIDPELAGGDIQTFKRKLKAKSVTTIPHFGPLYRFKILEQMGYNAEEIAKTCPVTEEYFDHRFTHLPLYDLTQEQLTYMADCVLEVIKEMQEGR